MRKLLVLSLILLGGCTHTSQTPDISGLWINQAAIDSAAQGRSLLRAIDAHGLNLEWNIDTRSGKAQFSNAFELGEGQLLPKAPGMWTVDYNGYGSNELQLDGKQLIQQATNNHAGQVFSRPAQPAAAGAKWGATFRQALNSAYMGGQWRIIGGPGTGNIVAFKDDGGVSGLGQNDRYELCLGGDCATQGAGNDTLYLGKGDVGDGWIFVRYGKQLEIFSTINLSRPDEIPQLTPGPRQWLLEKQ
ncbi:MULTISPECIES: hypothetical protein [unclassified Pseudomonas]|uniref:hypothetical protein n=1 Tax=unclassified Pseudomonas TaxID=196821 RepID=UPI002AC8A19D|nr:MULTISPECIES: hypothetical protein [unclassified Pseudomonas]MEB0045736.1 hypothetical protein [Pseudomonas sp. Dout3]MEB0098161.1 hypothetical protein [Pseudomonas sp. DC1.2]WPX60108.1 hypothetical protein RHM68_05565 [Pseudomonas sp. DC1.2]